MFNSDYSQVGYIITIISLIHGTIACAISFVVVTVIFWHLYHFSGRMKQEDKIILLISANIYFFMFLYLLTLVLFNIQTLIGDAYGNNFDSSWCIIHGYLCLVTCCGLYQGFVVQALFRFGRIVYSRYRWFQYVWFYVTAAPIQLILSIILQSPLLICLLWATFSIYSIPLICLIIIYIRIIYFIRQQSNNVTLIVKRNQERDLIAIRRIIINISLLCAIGLPGLLCLAISVIMTGMPHPLNHRILWIGAEVTVLPLAIWMILTTTQLKQVFMRGGQQNQVSIIENVTPMRFMTAAQ